MKLDFDELDDYAPEIVGNAKPGDVVWTYCDNGHIYKGTVVSCIEGPGKDLTYEITTEHSKENEYVSVYMAFRTQDDAAMAAIADISNEYTQFCANLMHSFTGEAPTGYVNELNKPEPRFKAGDTVWFQQPHCEYNTYKGIVTGIKKIRDPFDSGKTVFLYIIESRNDKSKKKYTQQLTDYHVFGSYNQSKMAYAAKIMGGLADGVKDIVMDLNGSDYSAEEANAEA